MQAINETKPERQPREAGTFTKRLGSTTYTVNVHFSDTSRETMNDKIIRMIKNEAAKKTAKS